MKKWDAADWIVFILTSTIAFGFLCHFVEGLISNVETSGENSKIIGRLLDSILAIISVYVGAKIQKHLDNGKGNPR